MTTGWCDTRDTHDGGYEHTRQPTCRNFISDAEHTDQLVAQAHEHDRKTQILYPSGATDPAADYVAQHRPY
ncbi:MULTISPECIES: hypothetical protein [Mycolicibacter]|uniref:Uncharacterized protein n=1 Tax=Mycolicibacter longobardus TaxID=1108812 RepID=A0A1X1YBR0_9MYCO|nr:MULTISPECIES: hypothetical protein [Mycolicibacter]ORW08552.1 hypothetical protein AWC16_19330 [Mycolicibacter longobardus]RAV04336.1 hypothetical protein DQP56_00520 [Mycolicibacter senuensis]